MLRYKRKNLADERPTDELFGRTLFTTKFVEKANIKDKTVLDIGCKFGWFELYAANHGSKKITGIDLTEADLETARVYLNNKKIDLRVGDALDLPFKDKSFDTVTAWEVIEHLPKDKENEMFREVWRVLKEGGAFYLSTPNQSFFSQILDPLWWFFGHRHYSINQLKHLAKANFFKPANWTVRGGFWILLYDLNMYLSKWLFRRKPFFKSFFVRRTNSEFRQQNGFATLFIKLSKK